MATLLLAVIFVDFIGLGLPDSLFGAAWPAIYTQLNLPVSLASCVTVLVAAGTIVSSLVSAKVVNRFGPALVTAGSTCLTALGLLGYSVSGNLLSLCVLALPLGIGGGCVDTVLNNYVATHYSATCMSFMHCFYGVGVSISPYIMAIALGDGNKWRTGYRYAFFVQAAIALITIISIPIWNKAHPKDVPEHGESKSKPATVSIREMASMRNVRRAWLIFFASCAIECTCSAWGATYLVNARGLTEASAAGTVTFFFAGMAVGRFLSGVLSRRTSPWRLIKMGACVMAASIALLALPLPAFMAGFALFGVGLGNGPLFPNMVYLTPRSFGEDISQSVMGTQMAAAYVGIMIMPPVFGLIAQNISSGLFPYYLMANFIVMALAIVKLYGSLLAENRTND